MINWKQLSLNEFDLCIECVDRVREVYELRQHSRIELVQRLLIVNSRIKLNLSRLSQVKLSLLARLMTMINSSIDHKSGTFKKGTRRSLERRLALFVM